MYTQKLGTLLHPSTYTRLSKRFNWSRVDAEYFAQLFDLPTSQAKVYRYRHKLPHIPRHNLETKAAIFRDMGITLKEWLKYPVLFKQPCCLLEQQYLLLQEAGARSVTGGVLAHFQNCKRKRISLLKTFNILDENANVAENLISHLNPREDNFPIDNFNDECIFEDVHHSILTRYFAWRLNISQDDVQKFYRTTSFKLLKSLRHICENLNLLLRIGYSSADILNNGFLLKFQPSNLRGVLEDIPYLAGLQTPEALRLYPRIIGYPPEHYIRMSQVLKEADIPDQSIQSYMDVFLLDPDEVELILNELKGVPAMQILFNSPDILKTIKKHSEVRSRLDFLQDIQFKCASVHLLIMPTANFVERIHRGKDATNLKDIIALLQILLHTTSSEMETNLRKHPYSCYVPLSEIKDSCRCLLEQLNFSPVDIIGAIQIVLHPKNKIMEMYRTVADLQELEGRTITPLQRLNLMIYFLEKEYHFKGDGVWRTQEELL